MPMLSAPSRRRRRLRRQRPTTMPGCSPSANWSSLLCLLALAACANGVPANNHPKWSPVLQQAGKIPAEVPITRSRPRRRRLQDTTGPMDSAIDGAVPDNSDAPIPGNFVSMTRVPVPGGDQAEATPSNPAGPTEGDNNNMEDATPTASDNAETAVEPTAAEITEPPFSPVVPLTSSGGPFGEELMIGVEILVESTATSAVNMDYLNEAFVIFVEDLMNNWYRLRRQLRIRQLTVTLHDDPALIYVNEHLIASNECKDDTLTCHKAHGRFAVSFVEEPGGKDNVCRNMERSIEEQFEEKQMQEAYEYVMALHNDDTDGGMVQLKAGGQEFCKTLSAHVEPSTTPTPPAAETEELSDKDGATEALLAEESTPTPEPTSQRNSTDEELDGDIFPNEQPTDIPAETDVEQSPFPTAAPSVVAPTISPVPSTLVPTIYATAEAGPPVNLWATISGGGGDTPAPAPPENLWATISGGGGGTPAPTYLYVPPGPKVIKPLVQTDVNPHDHFAFNENYNRFFLIVSIVLGSILVCALCLYCGDYGRLLVKEELKLREQDALYENDDFVDEEGGWEDSGADHGDYEDGDEDDAVFDGEDEGSEEEEDDAESTLIDGDEEGGSVMVEDMSAREDFVDEENGSETTPFNPLEPSSNPDSPFQGGFSFKATYTGKPQPHNEDDALPPVI